MGLPSGYKQLTYIQSTGSQCLNTDFVPNSKSRIEMKIAITDYSTNNCFFCSRDKTSSTDSATFTAFYIKATSSVAGHYRFDCYTKSKTSSSAEELNAITNVSAENGILTIGSTVVEVEVNENASTMPWLLLASATASAITTISNAAKAKLYSCKIYDNGTLVRNFIPCENSSKVVGMYDLVNDKFYQSATSTAFVGGGYKMKKGDILTYDYTGAVQTVTLPKGIYKLECWGAQGGSYNTSYLGGLGGYSVGTLTLTEDTLLNIYVGQQPAAVTSNRVSCPGGWNGGGAGYNRYYSSTYTYGQGGGGATDIRITGTTLYSRVIVAGGGGGSASVDDSKTKYGGGETGGCAQSGGGGTQTSGGSASNMTAGTFGTGADVTTSGTNYKYSSGGGGGGWYGGGACSTYNDSTNYRPYNGGGSGYVYTSSTASNYPSGCLLNSAYYLTDAQTIGGNTAFPTTDGTGTETGHSGNGYAKITALKVGSVPFICKMDGAWKEASSAYIKMDGTWKEISELKSKMDSAWK